MTEIEKLREIVADAKRMVFFGGAGVSTESGIPDFRSADGLYHQQYDYPPEEILSHTFFLREPEEFYRFYRDKMLCLSAKPNKAHLKLAEWEREGRLRSVVTQNIDGLHQAAGSVRVHELHGSVLRNRCMSCGKLYGVEKIVNTTGVPRCDCGRVIKPEVVLYEEALPEDTVTAALEDIRRADVMIVAGTSLTVYPAASYIRYFGGSHLILINRDKTQYDRIAELVIHDKVGEVLSQV